MCRPPLAAAALVACDVLWGAELGTAELLKLASRLGADVPFALLGGTAIGTGRGDQLSPALAKGRFDWVVVPSDAGLSTPEVYAHLDELRPGLLTANGHTVAGGDTLICACSRAAAAEGRCHRVWAAEVLREAGWDVVLDGHLVR